MKDVVSIKLQGGLSNYMFQISAAYSYAEKFDKQLILNLSNAIVIHKPIDNYKNNVFKNVYQFDSAKNHNCSTLNENGFSFSELEYVKGNVLLIGYFQSDKYFKEFENDIKMLFAFPQDITDAIKERHKDLLSKETCSIHVRRGDYVNQPQHHPTQDISYYMKAAKKVGMDKTFLIFSDDIKWCRENFPEMDNLVFIEGQKDYGDFCLMTLCTHNIICNSSFSWWAAWLNQNQNKVVVAPKKWFGSAYIHFDTKDLYCEKWILI